MSGTTDSTTTNPAAGAPVAPPAAPNAPAAAPVAPAGGTDDVDIFTAAAGAVPQKDADGKTIKPDYIADQFWDADKGEVKVAELAKSQRDLRAQIAKGAPAKGAVPEKDTDYALPKIEGLPDGIIGGEKDTLWPEIRAAAHKAGISNEQLAAVATPYLKQVAKQLADQQAAIDPEKRREADLAELRAEIAKLGPDGPAVAAEMKGWLDGLVSRGIMTKDEDASLRRVADANGVRALMKLRDMAGGGAIPISAIDDAAGSQEDFRRMLTEGYAKNDTTMQAKARRGLEALEKAGQLVA